MAVFNGSVYAGTNNQSTGSEIWRTDNNGTTWSQVNPDGFGDSNTTDIWWNSGATVFNNNLYFGMLNSAKGGEVWKMLVLAAPVLVSPGNNSTTPNHKPAFKWNKVTGASSYTIQVSTSSTFKTMLVNAKVTPLTYTPTINLPAGKLYWRVQANGPSGGGLWSLVWSVTIKP